MRGHQPIDETILKLQHTRQHHTDEFVITRYWRRKMYLLDSGSIVEDSVGTPECEGHLRGPDSGGGHHPPGHAGGCSECHCVGCGGGLLVCN